MFYLFSITFFLQIHFLYRVIQYLFIEKNIQYYILHILFNFWIIYIVWQDTVYTFFSTESLQSNFQGYNNSGIYSTLGIVIFHLHHIIVSWSDLTLSDKIHHCVSAVFVPVLIFTFLLNNLRALSTSNFFMSGLPGSISYICLILNKYNIISKVREKQISMYLNLIIRLPGQILSSIV